MASPKVDTVQFGPVILARRLTPEQGAAVARVVASWSAYPCPVCGLANVTPEAHPACLAIGQQLLERIRRVRDLQAIRLKVEPALQAMRAREAGHEDG